MAGKSTMDEIANIPNEEYEAHIKKLSPDQLNAYIEIVVSYMLSAVGAGIQLRQGQLETAAGNGTPPAALALTPEALESFRDEFRRRFQKKFLEKKYQVNQNKIDYLWKKCMTVGQTARDIANRDQAASVDLACLDEALHGISDKMIALTARFNRIKDPIHPLFPLCDN